MTKQNPITVSSNGGSPVQSNNDLSVKETQMTETTLTKTSVQTYVRSFSTIAGLSTRSFTDADFPVHGTLEFQKSDNSEYYTLNWIPVNDKGEKLVFDVQRDYYAGKGPAAWAAYNVITKYLRGSLVGNQSLVLTAPMGKFSWANGSGKVGLVAWNYANDFIVNGVPFEIDPKFIPTDKNYWRRIRMAPGGIIGNYSTDVDSGPFDNDTSGFLFATAAKNLFAGNCLSVSLYREDLFEEAKKLVTLFNVNSQAAFVSGVGTIQRDNRFTKREEKAIAEEAKQLEQVAKATEQPIVIKAGAEPSMVPTVGGGKADLSVWNFTTPIRLFDPKVDREVRALTMANGSPATRLATAARIRRDGLLVIL